MSEGGKDVSFVLPALYGRGGEWIFLKLCRGMAEKGLSVELAVAGDGGLITDKVWLLVSWLPEVVADAMCCVALRQYPAPSRGDVDRHLDRHRLERVVEFYLSWVGL